MQRECRFSLCLSILGILIHLLSSSAPGEEPELNQGSNRIPVIATNGELLQPLPEWLLSTRVGYNRGFVIASGPNVGMDPDALAPFVLRINGIGQLRHTVFDSQNDNPDLNQFQLKRGRFSLSGNAFMPELRYFVQLDGRSIAGEEFRLLDYFMEFDLGNRWLDMDRRKLVFKTGRYKVPFTLSRDISAREFQFADRSVASMYFDINRSLGWSIGGETDFLDSPAKWEASLFNGFITGGAETGSGGDLDNNFAYSTHFFFFPNGDWGTGALSDFEGHETLATRLGAGYAGTTIDRQGASEFNIVRVVDSGRQLGPLLPAAVDEYSVNTLCLSSSSKYRGWSSTLEYYFRSIDDFQGADLSELFDHGFWLQIGKFVIPRKLELLSRWSRVVGTSGSLGEASQSAEEIAGGAIWYFNGQDAKLTVDATWLNGAPINAPSLDIFPEASGWLARTQIQFAF